MQQQEIAMQRVLVALGEGECQPLVIARVRQIRQDRREVRLYKVPVALQFSRGRCLASSMCWTSSSVLCASTSWLLSDGSARSQKASVAYAMWTSARICAPALTGRQHTMPRSLWTCTCTAAGQVTASCLRRRDSAPL